MQQRTERERAKLSKHLYSGGVACSRFIAPRPRLSTGRSPLRCRPGGAGFRRTQYNCWYLRLFDPFSHVALEEAGEIKVLLIFSHCALVHCQIAAGLDQDRGCWLKSSTLDESTCWGSVSIPPGATRAPGHPKGPSSHQRTVGPNANGCLLYKKWKSRKMSLGQILIHFQF